MNYYNEIDPLKAETIREAIKAGAIAPGDVDERSIADVRPADLAGYVQCHFFAGGGFWSLAARAAGWPDDVPAWTGSCPCPSFSSAGKGGGFDDPRHLWPHWGELIQQCRPPVVFGEQADDAVGYGWLDLVQTDLEAAAYSVGKVVFGAHSVGAPHIRQRLYFVADTSGGRCEQWDAGQRPVPVLDPRSALGFLGDASGRGLRIGGDEVGEGSGGHPYGSVIAGDMGHAHLPGSTRHGRNGGEVPAARGVRVGPSDSGQHGGLGATEGARLQERIATGGGDGRAAGAPAGPGLECGGDAGSVADTLLRGRKRRPSLPERETEGRTLTSGSSENSDLADAYQHRLGTAGIPGSGEPQRHAQSRRAVRGFWRDAEWIPCRDPKVPGGIEWRPIEPGTFPLAHGYPQRVGILRLAGDAIVVTQAAEWIRTYIEARGLRF